MLVYYNNNFRIQTEVVIVLSVEIQITPLKNVYQNLKVLKPTDLQCVLYAKKSDILQNPVLIIQKVYTPKAGVASFVGALSI